MSHFKKAIALVSIISLCVTLGFLIVPTMANSTGIHLTQIRSAQLVTEHEVSQLPSWLQALDLSEEQTRQVLEIDKMLDQRLFTILTSEQYRQWHASQADISNEIGGETWNFDDLGIALSAYQQVAVEASFQSAMRSLLGILSTDQKQQLVHSFLEEGVISEPDILGI